MLNTILIGIGLSLITVFADASIKYASLQKAFSGWPMLVLGGAIYGATALGWFYIVREIKLSSTGVLYGVSCIVLLTFVSVFYFKEPVNIIEIIGIVFGIISVVILFRFA